MKRCLILATMVLSIISCDNSENAEKSSNKIVYEDYLPFKFVDEEKWGMISADGKILFSGKYDDSHSVINNEGEIEDIDIDISPALNGLFLMTNKSNTKDYYTATKEPKFVFGGFQEAGLFREDVTPTVKKGEWIKFINKNGEVVFDFKEVNGINVKEVSNFYNGVAIFELEDETYGCIDTKGKVVVEPQSEYIEFCMWDRYILENGIITIGNKVLNLQKGWEIDREEGYFYSDAFSPYSDYYALEIQSDEEDAYIIYDSNGNKIKQTNYKVIALSGENYIFKKGNKLGIASLDGDIIMPPSYDVMNFIDYDKVLCGNMEYEGMVKISSLSGELIYQEYTQQPYALITLSGLCYRSYKDNTTFFRKWGGNFVFINNKGDIVSNEQIETLVDFARYTDNPEEWVHSDYFDYESIIKRIALTDVGVCGVTPNNTLKDFYDKFSNDISNDDLRRFIGQNKLLPISLNVSGVSLLMNVYFFSDVYPDYQLAYNEKPYVIEVSIGDYNFDNTYSVSDMETEAENEHVAHFFEYLYKYYCDKYYIMKKEKKDSAFYLEIGRLEDANSILVYRENGNVNIVISESGRSLYSAYGNIE